MILTAWKKKEEFREDCVNFLVECFRLISLHSVNGKDGIMKSIICTIANPVECPPKIPLSASKLKEFDAVEYHSEIDNSVTVLPFFLILLFFCFCRHGDMLFLFPSSTPGSSSENMDTSISQGTRPLGVPQVVEDEIDQYLIKQDGKIYRSRDQQL